VHGGDAGQPGFASFASGGGGAGVTGVSGGSGGAGGTSTCSAVVPGGDGGFGAGGAGGSSHWGSGGGGGGGYYGGGGGTGDNTNGTCLGGGGGGGGSSYVVSGATNVGEGLTSSAASVSITPVTPPHVSLSASALTFGTTSQGTLSAPQSLTITNTGIEPLDVGDLTTTGANPDDFLVTGCRSPLGTAGSCTLEVHFAPQGPGVRSATLEISSDDPASPATVSLSGTGGALPEGPQGASGASGATGPKGAAGPQGPAGEVELVTCRTTGHGKKKHKKCTTKLVSGPVKITRGGRARATLLRDGRVYARGTSGVLRATRDVPAGRYTLRLSYRGRTHDVAVTVR
jgi:hypothetical protein